MEIGEVDLTVYTFPASEWMTSDDVTLEQNCYNQLQLQPGALFFEPRVSGLFQSLGQWGLLKKQTDNKRGLVEKKERSRDPLLFSPRSFSSLILLITRPPFQSSPLSESLAGTG